MVSLRVVFVVAGVVRGADRVLLSRLLSCFLGSLFLILDPGPGQPDDPVAPTTYGPYGLEIATI